jgi:hypothetical protein
MCLPVALAIPIALAVATTAVSVVGQIQSANAANAAIKAQLKAKTKRSTRRPPRRSTTGSARRREQGRIMVAAGESGLSLESGSVKALQTDAEMQATLSNETSLANRESRKEAPRSRRRTPTWCRSRRLLGAGLQIALAGANAAQAPGPSKGKGTALMDLAKR